MHLTWTARAAEYPAAIRAAVDDPDIDGVLVIYAPAVAHDVETAAAHIHAGGHGASKPVVAVLLGGGDGPVTPGSGVPSFTFPEQAAAVLGRSYAYARWRQDELLEPLPSSRPVDPAAAQAIVASVLDGSADPGSSVVVDLAERQQLLAAYGIHMAASVASSPDDAVDAANRLGYPVAVKAVRRRPGRSARAGVALDLTSDLDVREALATMRESLEHDADDLVVQQMAAPGVDVRIRCEVDERLGAIVSVGLGGAQADAIDDRTTRLAPVSPATAATMLGETRLAAALEAAGFDPSPVVDAIVLAAHLVSDHPEVVELDMNPVIVSDVAAVVADVLVRLAPVTSGDGPLRRLD
jgi:acyl-CoA synthetase (NDP forming)